MEAEASGILSSYLAQAGFFGLGLVVIGFFVWLWMRESRAVRADTETIIARKDAEIVRKDAEIVRLSDALAASEEKERITHQKLMQCLYPRNGGVKDD